MGCVNKTVAVAGALILSLTPLMARAQTAITDPSLDQRLRNAPGLFQSTESADDAVLTGRDDILLVGKRRLFTGYAVISAGHTTNATLANPEITGEKPRGDDIGTLNLGLRAATRIGGRVDVYAEVGAVTSAYKSQTELGFVAGTAAVGVHTRVLTLDIDAAYAPAKVWDRTVNEVQLDQDRYSVAVSRSFRLHSAIAQVSVGRERVTAHPAPYSHSATTYSASLMVPVSRTVVMQAGITGAERDYDNYFEDFVGRARRDRWVQTGVGLSWTPLPWLGVDARVSRTQNRSSADISRYRVDDASVAIRLRKEF